MYQHRHRQGSRLLEQQEERIGLLVGTPNVGKSVIFNQLTGHYAVVSNYPGTSIEITSAEMNLGHGQSYTLIDTPGINGLLPFSEDEKVTQRIILEKKPSFVIQVADSKNLIRTLRLTFQLQELDCPLILALNMSDEAEQKGLSIDTEELSTLLGIDVVLTAAPVGRGISKLRRLIPQAVNTPRRPLYGPIIESAVKRIATLLEKHGHTARLLAVLLLGRDPFIGQWLGKYYPREVLDTIDEIVLQTEKRFARPIHLVMAATREKSAAELANQVITLLTEKPGTIAEKIGVWTRRPVTGIPFFLLVIYLMYKIVGQFAAGTMVGFMEEIVFGKFINPWVTRALDFVPWQFARDLFVGQFGLVSMGLTYAIAIVLPIVGVFFFCFGFLEDSGYLPRLSIMSNRIFRRIGLNGKAILPMVLGLGCGTMATLTARILETKKERLIVTLLLALGIPCSAQLGVMLAMMATLNPWAVLTIIAVIASQLLLVGYLASKILPGEGSDFILEIPPIRLPRLSNLALKTYLRIEWFLKEAIPVFLIGTLIVFLADKTGLLKILEDIARPVVVHWLQLPAETVLVFIMGFFRRDYGAAHLFDLSRAGLVNGNQMVVCLVVITLFIPCIAQFLVIVKEQGIRKALAMAAFVFPFAVFIGGLLNLLLKVLNIAF